jgi:hypothetical protein
VVALLRGRRRRVAGGLRRRDGRFARHARVQEGETSGLASVRTVSIRKTRKFAELCVRGTNFFFFCSFLEALLR